ncbi:MAG: hypothetical protein U5Q44_08305 [Dehalococcoidia bacterium]|nr:hypothetical protein [Dehalococcoidia bacterium]
MGLALLHPREGKFTIVEGDPGLGKSWLSLSLASAISRGTADGFPGLMLRRS